MLHCQKLAVVGFMILVATNLTTETHAATTNWIANSGVFTQAANWDNGVPDIDATTVFNRGMGVAYTVTFPGGPILNPPPNYFMDYLRVHSNNVTFADNSSASVSAPSLTVNNGGVSIIVGENSGEVAILTTSLSSLSATQASIGRNPGANGTLNVTAGTFSLIHPLEVGYSGTGTLNITGGSVSDSTGYIGRLAGSTGTATVSGAASTWTNSDEIQVGVNGTGTLRIEADGSATDRYGYIGLNPGSMGTATVTGAGSTWTNSNDFYVGYQGTGTLRIEAGGRVESSVGNVGEFANSEGHATVSGTGSTWTNSLDLDIGFASTGTLTIEAGGSVSSSNFSTIGYDPTVTGTVTVTGAGSTWTNSGQIGIGIYGTGMLAIEAGGSVSSSSAVIGDIFDSNGTATVTGIGSTWTNSGFLFVGDAGSGTLSIEAGGSVSDTNSRLGNFFNSTGTVTVTGADATWTNSSTLDIGYGGTGTLTIEDGGSVSSQSSSIGTQSFSNGMVTVTGAGSTWTNTSTLSVGMAGTGTLTIEDGGSVSSEISYISQGTATVTGIGSTWTSSTDLSVGNFATGTLSIEDGGSVSSVTSSIATGGASFTANVTVTGAGSTWNNSGSVNVGSSGGGKSSLTVGTGATVSIGQDLVIGNTGTVNLQGGQINLASAADLIFSGGAFNFSHGTLNFTTSQAIGASGPIQQALGGERRVRVGQHLEVDGTLTLNAPFQIDGGGLTADSLAVNSDLVFTAGLLEVRGGAITGVASLVVPGSGELRTNGIHSFRVTGQAGSTITATGNLTLGNASAVNGFGTQGTVQVGANTLTLLDANDVVFDSLALATLGSGASPGTLTAANGLTLDFGGNVTGFGSVSTPNLVTKPLINNGHIIGNSAAEKITLPGYVKGVGTFDNVNLTGTFSPGLSPTLLSVGNVALSPTSTLIMELGGATPGSGYDQIQSSSTLAFDGTLQVTLINGFTPAAGQSFNLFDWASVSGTFSSLALPTLAGLAWNTSQLYTTGVLSVTSAAVPGDYNNNGTVDAADYLLWRKGGPLANEVDNPGTVNAADYTAWRARFGNSGSGAGATAGGSAFAVANLPSSAVPEPSTHLIALAMGALVLLCYRATPKRANAAPLQNVSISLVRTLVLSATIGVASPTLAVTTNWTAYSGYFTDPANWDMGVPDSDDTAVFNRGFVAYEVNFPGGSIFDPPPNYPIEYLRVHTNEVSFVYTESPFVTIPSLTVLNPDVSIVIGENDGDVAILNMAINSLSGANATIGQAFDAVGTLNVGGTFSISGALTVGDSGTGTLNVTGGGSVSNQDCEIGSDAFSSSFVTVTGVSSTWTNRGNLTVGNEGTGYLSITDGGAVSSNAATIAADPFFTFSSGSTVSVTGAGSTWTISNALTVGFTGSLTIGDGGIVSNTEGFIGTASSSFWPGEVTVTGAGSAWNMERLSIGNAFGVRGVLHIEPCGTVSVVQSIVLYEWGDLFLQGGTLAAQSVSFQGGGQFQFNSGTLHVGVYNGDLTNIGGVLAPGHSAGSTMINGDYTQQSAGTLEIEIESPTSFDQLEVTGNLTLGGTLNVAFIGGYIPAANAHFDILDWGSLTGTFSMLNLPSLAGGLTWNTSALYTNGVLSVAAPGVPGDYNNNGAVDAADYVLWRKGGPLANEVDDPGTVNAADYTAWRARFGNSGTGSGSGATGSASAPVPEPHFLLMLAAGGMLLAVAAGRKRHRLPVCVRADWAG